MATKNVMCRIYLTSELKALCHIQNFEVMDSAFPSAFKFKVRQILYAIFIVVIVYTEKLESCKALKISVMCSTFKFEAWQILCITFCIASDRCDKNGLVQN